MKFFKAHRLAWRKEFFGSPHKGVTSSLASLHGAVARRLLLQLVGLVVFIAQVGCVALPGVDSPQAQPHAPDSPPIEVANLANSLYDQGQYRQAQAILSGLTQAHPGQAYFWFRLGNCETQLGHYSAAITAFEQALRIDPNNGRVSYNLALAHSATARDAFAMAKRQLAVGSPLRKDAEQYRRLLEVAVGRGP